MVSDVVDVLTVVFLFVAILFLILSARAHERRAAALQIRVEHLEEFSPLWDVVRCRACGCTEDAACMSGCWWVEEDLCSSCADDAIADAHPNTGEGR